MKRIMFVLMFVLLLSVASAQMEFDNWKTYDKETKTITITNMFTLGDILQKVRLVFNTYTCGNSCEAEKEVTLYKEDNLVEDVRFYSIDAKGKYKLVDFNNYQLQYQNEELFYRHSCKVIGILKNGTNDYFCEYTKPATRKEWVDFEEKDVFPEGVYQVKLLGWKNPSQSLDWQIKVQGKWIDEWAVWGNISDGDGAEVILLNVTDGFTTQNNTIVYNASANVTGGAGLTNMSLYTNSTGSWHRNQTETFSAGGSIEDGQTANDGGNDIGNAANISITARTDGIMSSILVGSRGGEMNVNVSIIQNGVTLAFKNITIDINDQKQLNFTTDDYSALIGATIDNGAFRIVMDVLSGTNLNGKSAQNFTGSHFNYSTQNVNWKSFSDDNDIIMRYSNVTTLPTFTTRKFVSNIPTGSTTWNVEGCDDEGGCGFAVSNRTVILAFPPTVTLVSPIETENFTTRDIVFSCNAFDDVALTNVSVLLDSVINQTNSSAINNSDYNFTITGITEASHNWTCLAFDSNDLATQPSARNFTITLTPPTVTLNNPSNNTNTTNSTIDFNCTAFDDVAIANVTLIIDGVDNETNSSGVNNSNYLFNQPLTDGSHNWTCRAFDTDGKTTTATNFTVNVDSTNPQVLISAPTGNITLQETNQDLAVNWTVLDEHTDTCIVEYSGVNATITCNDNGTFINTTSSVNKSLVLYTNDTFGNVNVSTTSWDYLVFLNNETFSETTIEGSSETFSANVNILSGFSLSLANLFYNASANLGTTVNNGGGNFDITRILTIPNIGDTVNISFFWSLTLNSGDNINTTANNQTVSNITLDDCAVNTVLVLNLTMIDEEDQTFLNGSIQNTTIEVDVDLTTIPEGDNLVNFSNSYSEINPAQVCLNINLSSSSFRLDSIIRYESANRVSEFYNIQNFTLDNDSTEQNINLFDLLTVDSTEFQITFKDSSFVIVENALIQINRQYISEGIFKTVELPKTDSNGQTVAHLVEKDVVYNMIVIKEGIILGTFNNLIAFCEDATIGSCFISLNAVGTNEVVFNYDTEIGLASIFTYNETTRVLQYDFTTLDGSVKVIQLLSTKLDQLGTTVACNETVVSSSGTILCTIPGSVGNETIINKVFADGNLVVNKFIEAGKRFDIGDTGYFLMLFLVLSLASMFVQSKAGVIAGVVIGLIASLLLGFVEGGIIGVGSSTIWLILTAVILIWKLNKDSQT